MNATPHGRYAPSPSGELHLGNGSTALLAWLSVRARDGRFSMRIEDLDQARSRLEYVERCLEDLSWFGIDWDGELLTQSDEAGRYHNAFEALRSAGRLYPCFCRRKDIAAAASAPQEPGEMRRYPGLCRALDEGEAASRVQGGERHAWRFRVEPGQRPTFVDLVHGEWGADRREPSDFVVYRADGVPAYQLAVVVDDAAQGISEVVRGDDLLSSTPAQLLLYEALGYTAPQFAHVPLLLGPDGVRLSKRHSGITLREVRESGLSAEQVVGHLAKLLGIRNDSSPIAASDLIERFTIQSLQTHSPGYPVTPDDWR
jgi:glutamyl-tRNA synthetase